MAEILIHEQLGNLALRTCHAYIKQLVIMKERKPLCEHPVFALCVFGSELLFLQH